MSENDSNPPAAASPACRCVASCSGLLASRCMSCIAWAAVQLALLYGDGAVRFSTSRQVLTTPNVFPAGMDAMLQKLWTSENTTAGQAAAEDVAKTLLAASSPAERSAQVRRFWELCL